VTLADQGVIGCVTRIATIHRDGKTYDLARPRYRAGALIAVESNLGTQHFEWERGVPTERDELPPRRSLGRIEWSILGRSVVDVDARGRPLRVWNAEPDRLVSSGEFAWDGDRLDTIQWASYEAGTPEPGLPGAPLRLLPAAAARPLGQRSWNPWRAGRGVSVLRTGRSPERA
jgi:hypothetical protein